ncbi:MAG: hypothetical protein ACR2OG_03620 [Gemmatimonadaceae bacterium]
MTRTRAVTHAIAVEFRHTHTDEVMGIAVVVPSEHYVSLISGDTGLISAPALSAEAWGELAAWDEKVAARLPFKPAPMYASIVDALLGGTPGSEVIARRFAAIPVTVDSRGVLTPQLENILPGLLSSRRAA